MVQAGLDHVEIYVSDLGKSTAFWDWLLEDLGFGRFQKWPKGISWKRDDSYIVFVQAETAHLDPPYHRKRVGLNHLAFHVNDRDYIDELTRRLDDRGVTILYADRHPCAGGQETYAIFFEDPDRIKVEVVYRMDGSQAGSYDSRG